MRIVALQLLHGNDIGRLDVVLVLLNLPLELVQRHLLVLHDQVDLHLLDTKPNSHQLVRTPDEAIHLNGEHGLHQLVHVCLVIPRLHVERDERLRGRLDLALFLLLVLGQSLLALGDNFWVFFLLVGTEEVDFVIVVGGGGVLRVHRYRNSLGAIGSEGFGWVAGEGGEVGIVGLDMVVPAVGVGIELDGRGFFKGLEADNVGLRWLVSVREVLATDFGDSTSASTVSASRDKSEVQLLAVGSSHFAVS